MLFCPAPLFNFHQRIFYFCIYLSCSKDENLKSYYMVYEYTKGYISNMWKDLCLFIVIFLKGILSDFVIYCICGEKQYSVWINRKKLLVFVKQLKNFMFFIFHFEIFFIYKLFDQVWNQDFLIQDRIRL